MSGRRSSTPARGWQRSQGCEPRSACARVSWRQLVDAKLKALLRHQRRDLRDAELAGERALLIEVDRQLPPLHEREIRAGDEDGFQPALIVRDQLARALNLLLIGAVEEKQMLRERDDVERVRSGARGYDDVALGVGDVLARHDRRIEIEGARRLGVPNARKRRGMLDRIDNALLGGLF